MNERDKKRIVSEYEKRMRSIDMGLIIFYLLVGGLLWQFVLPHAEAWGLSIWEIAFGFLVHMITFPFIIWAATREGEYFCSGMFAHGVLFTGILGATPTALHPLIVALAGTCVMLFLYLIVWPLSYALASGVVRMYFARVS